MRRPWTFGLALLPSLLLPAAALAGGSGAEFQVTTTARYGADMPSAAMDEDGSFLLSWVADGYDVMARRYDPDGVPRAGEFQAGHVEGHYAGGTTVTLDRTGFLVVWGNDPKFTDSYDSFLMGQRFDREDHPLLPEPFEAASSFDSDVASSPEGSSVIVDVSGSRIVATRLDAAGRQIGGVIQVSDRGRGPEVAVDAAGGFVVAWQGVGGMFVRRYLATGIPRGKAFKVTADASYPVLAGNRQGQFAVAWRAGRSLWARFYSASAETRGKPVLVSKRIGEFSGYSAAMDAEGKVLVAWTCCSQTFFGSSALYGRWFDRTGAPAGGPFRINSGASPFAFAPDVASGPKDRFLVTWEDGVTVLARRLAWTDSRKGPTP